MAMMDAEPLFIDTNILIYANVAGAPFHKQALDALGMPKNTGGNCTCDSIAFESLFLLNPQKETTM